MNTTELRPLGTSAGHQQSLGADLLPAGDPTLQSLEAGLIALAHGLGREHAQRVRRAMNAVITAAPSLPAALPPTASLLGSVLDGNSLEQADA